MGLERTFVALLFLEALVCLWLAVVAWREAAGQTFIWRGFGVLLWCSPAAVILYGIVQS